MKNNPQSKQKLKILFEDNHLLAVVKPFNMPTQTDISKDNSLLKISKQYIKSKYNKPGNVYLGLLHRLDRPVCGIILFAKTSKAASRMSKQFRDRNITKNYIAVVEGSIKIGENKNLQNFLQKNKKNNKTTICKQPRQNSKIAILQYSVLDTNNVKIYKRYFKTPDFYLNSKHYSILKINLKTGLSHQIRVQLSNIGHPILGDIKYNAAQPLPQKNIMLLASQLIFNHPVNKQKISLHLPL